MSAPHTAPALATLLSGGADSAALAALAAHLDALDPPERVRQVAALPGRALGRLFEQVEGQAVGLEHFVPADVAQGVPVRHVGVNSLPLFRRFEKRFMRVPGGGNLWGYNHQAMRWLTGPGYFVVAPAGAGEDLCIDYHSVPDGQPGAGWPDVRGNEGFPDRFVYGFMRDHMRRVSSHVSIGRAERKGRVLNTWFALVRMEEGL
jgi:hypothetical protein